VVGFTIDSRGKVPGKTCEKIAMMIIIIILIIIMYSWKMGIRNLVRKGSGSNGNNHQLDIYGPSDDYLLFE
jgi:hypothetical protein